MGKNYRHGELGIFKVSQFEKSHKSTSSLVLAEGEITGHKHEIISGKVRVYDIVREAEELATKYLEVLSDTAVITHPEHGEDIYERGLYEIRPAREYQPEGWRRVSD